MNGNNKPTGGNMDNQNENKGPKFYERKPNFNTRAKLSRDGRFWIIERVETWILPRKYLDVIAENHRLESSQSQTPEISTKPKKKGKRNADSDGQGN
jgi:hypothetical protein